MGNTYSFRLHPSLATFCLIGAPLLLLLSQFFWEDQMVGNTAGWMQVIAFTLWIPAFLAMFSLLDDKMPIYASIGFVIAAYSCVGGSNFGMDGIYSDAFGINSVGGKEELHGKLGMAAAMALYLPGILFPLSLVVLGIFLIRTKRIELSVGILLIIAGIGFPLSRIPRIPAIAHIDNALLLISHAIIAFRISKLRPDNKVKR